MKTTNHVNPTAWQAEFNDRLNEAKQSLDGLLRDGAIECPVHLYFREGTETACGELRLARVPPEGDDWQHLDKPIRMNADVRSIMAEVAALARSLPVLLRR